MFFPKQVYLWGSILEKKRLDTLVGALCCVGRGFGRAGRAGLGFALGVVCWAGVGRAGLGMGLGCAGRASCLCMVYIVHVFFMMSLMCLCFGWEANEVAVAATSTA